MKNRAWILGACALAGALATSEARAEGARISAAAVNAAATREWDARITALASRGDLRLQGTREDTMIAGRTHTRLQQMHRGVPVVGGELVRQEDPAGTLTVYGGLYEGIDVDTVPVLSESAARKTLEAVHKDGRLFPSDVDLMILPLEGERGVFSYALTWRGQILTGADARVIYVDARTGAVRLRYSDGDTQNMGGPRTGVH